MNRKRTVRVIAVASLTAGVLNLLCFPMATWAAKPDRATLQCLAASAIVFKFSGGERQIAGLSDDTEFQEITRRVTRGAMSRLSGLSQQQVMEGMNLEMRGEAKSMSDAVFKRDNENLSDAEMGQRLKAYMTTRFDKLRCLSQS